jgi:hypothetical protein
MIRFGIEEIEMIERVLTYRNLVNVKKELLSEEEEEKLVNIQFKLELEKKDIKEYEENLFFNFSKRTK